MHTNINLMTSYKFISILHIIFHIFMYFMFFFNLCCEALLRGTIVSIDDDDDELF